MLPASCLLGLSSHYCYCQCSTTWNCLQLCCSCKYSNCFDREVLSVCHALTAMKEFSWIGSEKFRPGERRRSTNCSNYLRLVGDQCELIQKIHDLEQILDRRKKGTSWELDSWSASTPQQAGFFSILNHPSTRHLQYSTKWEEFEQPVCYLSISNSKGTTSSL